MFSFSNPNSSSAIAASKMVEMQSSMNMLTHGDWKKKNLYRLIVAAEWFAKDGRYVLKHTDSIDGNTMNEMVNGFGAGIDTFTGMGSSNSLANRMFKPEDTQSEESDTEEEEEEHNNVFVTPAPAPRLSIVVPNDLISHNTRSRRVKAVFQSPSTKSKTSAALKKLR